MADDLNRYDLTWTSSRSFVLDEPKLTKIVDLVKDDAGPEWTESGAVGFRIRRRNGVSESLNTLEEVLQHDNRTRDPISSLTISSAWSPHGYCSVEFWASRSPWTILVTVHGSNRYHANRLLAELQEQANRTLVDSLIYRVKDQDSHRKALTLLWAAFAFLAIVTPWGAYLSKSSLAFLSELKWRGALLVVPPGGVIATIGYLYFRCYPKGSFLWGDALAAYQRLLATRSTLWTVVVLSFIVGSAASLAVAVIMGGF